MSLIELNTEERSRLCQKYKVQTLLVLGSILTDRFNDENDVDVLLHFRMWILLSYVIILWIFYKDHEELIGRKINLVSEDKLRNKCFIKK